MAQIVVNTPQRLELQSGSTKVTFDKSENTATLQRKILFVSRKPQTVPLGEIADATLDSQVDPASRAEFFRTLLKLGSGGAWVLEARDKPGALGAIAAVRSFLGMPPA